MYRQKDAMYHNLSHLALLRPVLPLLLPVLAVLPPAAAVALDLGSFEQLVDVLVAAQQVACGLKKEIYY